MPSDTRPTRREALLAAASVPLMAALRPEVARGDDGPPPVDAAAALDQLRQGNKRFAEGHVRHAHEAASWREHLKNSQSPFATILACSDSRVPPELVFDQGFGDIFVVRVAGNIIAGDVLGSIGYALRHLKTRLLVVMGHEGCGAVTAALDAMDGKGEEPKFIANLLKHITPGLKGLDPTLAGAPRVNAGVEANVRASIGLLRKVPEGRTYVESPDFRLVGAVYELGTGRVRFLD